MDSPQIEKIFQENILCWIVHQIKVHTYMEKTD